MIQPYLLYHCGKVDLNLGCVSSEFAYDTMIHLSGEFFEAAAQRAEPCV